MDEEYQRLNEINIIEYATNVLSWPVVEGHRNPRYRLFLKTPDEKVAITAKGNSFLWKNNGTGQAGAGAISFFQSEIYPGKNLGQIRAEMRPLIGLGERDRSLSSTSLPTSPAPAPAWADEQTPEQRQKVAKALSASSRVAGEQPYLESLGISRETIAKAGVYASRDGQFLYYPHRHPKDRSVMGLETTYIADLSDKTKRATPGSKKSCWGFGAPDAHSVVICESAPKAMAKHDLDQAAGLTGRVYISSGGNFGDPSAFAEIIKDNLAKGREVIPAFDNDQQGRADAAKLEKIVGKPLVAEFPTAKDWDDDLKAARGTPAPAPEQAKGEVGREVESKPLPFPMWCDGDTQGIYEQKCGVYNNKLAAASPDQIKAWREATKRELVFTKRDARPVYHQALIKSVTHIETAMVDRGLIQLSETTAGRTRDVKSKTHDDGISR